MTDPLDDLDAARWRHPSTPTGYHPLYDGTGVCAAIGHDWNRNGTCTECRDEYDPPRAAGMRGILNGLLLTVMFALIVMLAVAIVGAA